MRSRFLTKLAIAAALVFALSGAAAAQSDLSPTQRLDVMRSKLDGMRRNLSSAISSLGPAASEKKNPDDPRERLRGLDKEVGSVLSEVNNIQAKQERSERHDPTVLDLLEASVNEL